MDRSKVLMAWRVGFLCLTLMSAAGAEEVRGDSPDNLDLLVFTVATDPNDALDRYVQSLEQYNLKYKVVGMGLEWKGGDVATSPGGGFKVNLLKEALVEYGDREDLIIMFTDSYDVVLANGKEAILSVFKKCKCRVLFSAEKFCWPDMTLKNRYPPVKPTELPFLNSGGYIGYAKDIYELMTLEEIEDSDDDQLYFTRRFLDGYTKALQDSYYKDEKTSLHSMTAGGVNSTAVEDGLAIRLDRKSELFQNLNGALGDVTVQYKEDGTGYVYNTVTGSTPIVIHGNGPIKSHFNRLANYLNGRWAPSTGCKACSEGLFDLGALEEETYPEVFASLILDVPTPFMDGYFELFENLTYPRSKITVYLLNLHPVHTQAVDDFLSRAGQSYKKVHHVGVGTQEDLTAVEGRNKAAFLALASGAQYFLNVDSIVRLTNPNLLKDLIQRNRPVLSPLIMRPGQMWSNFWGALSSQGFYARSDDYMDIIKYQNLGQWNVPYVTGIYLIQIKVLEGLPQDPYTNADFPDPDMAICANLRKKNSFIFLDNTVAAGHLIKEDEFDPSKTAPELYQLFDNQMEWERKYLHKDYLAQLDPDFTMDEPCPDVYWFPLFSEAFCDELVQACESFGQWSSGTNEDARLEGGYENVPTRDIHMRQIGFHDHWIQLIREYVYPVQLKLYPGYFSLLDALMNFVVRYRPDEQPSLRPHHDSSTFTINAALNTVNVDYEGGGVRFLRYNCSLTALRKGWALIHPGRLTHFHEGLTTTKGTRYIMVSFINP